MTVKSYLLASLIGFPITGFVLVFCTFVMGVPFNPNGALLILGLAMTMAGMFFGNDIDRSIRHRQMERELGITDRLQWEK